eukprot:ANDGO_03393.mRNA.1 putative amino acid/polyamine transporter I
MSSARSSLNNPLLDSEEADLEDDVPAPSLPGIGWIMATVLSIANVAPTPSIFFILPVVLQDAGAESVWSVIISGIFCWSLAKVVSEFACCVSSSGSFHAYATLGLGQKSGLYTAWMMLFAYFFLGVQALLSLAGWVCDITNRWTGVEIPWPVVLILAACICTAMSYLGVQQSLKIGLILFIFETIVVLAMCFAFVIAGHPYAPGFSKENNPNGASGFLQSLIFGIMLFNGFESATSLGENAKDPTKVISRAVVGSIYTVQILISFAAYAFACAIGASDATNLVNLTSPADYYARKYVGAWFAAFVDIAGVTASFNLVLAQHAFNNNLLQTLGEGKMFRLHYFGKLSTMRRVPLRAILFSETSYVVVSILLGVISTGSGVKHSSSDYGSTRGCWDAFNLVTFVASIALLLVYLSPNAAIYSFMKTKHPDRYSLLKHAIQPAINIVAGVGYIGSQFYPFPDALDGGFCAMFATYLLVGIFVVRVSKPVEALETVDQHTNIFIALKPRRMSVYGKRMGDLSRRVWKASSARKRGRPVSKTGARVHEEPLSSEMGPMTVYAGGADGYLAPADSVIYSRSL